MSFLKGTSIYSRGQSGQQASPETGEIDRVNTATNIHDVYFDLTKHILSRGLAELHEITIEQHGNTNKKVKDSWHDAKGDSHRGYSTEAWVYGGHRYLDVTSWIYGPAGSRCRAVTTRFKTNIVTRRTEHWMVR